MKSKIQGVNTKIKELNNLANAIESVLQFADECEIKCNPYKDFELKKFPDSKDILSVSLTDAYKSNWDRDFLNIDKMEKHLPHDISKLLEKMYAFECECNEVQSYYDGMLDSVIDSVGHLGNFTCAKRDSFHFWPKNPLPDTKKRILNEIDHAKNCLERAKKKDEERVEKLSVEFQSNLDQKIIKITEKNLEGLAVIQKVENAKIKDLIVFNADQSIDRQLSEIIRNVLMKLKGQSKYLALGSALESNRNDFSDGLRTGRDAIEFFQVVTEEDRLIFNELSKIANSEETDGRVFRDCTYNYGYLYGLVDKKLMADFMAVKDLASSEEIY